MIKVVSFKICPFVQRITALLEAKQIPYEIEYISLDNKPQWFLEISPNAQVPVLITETGTALFESDAIAEYLDEVYSPLEENLTPEQRALDRAWVYQASKQYLPQCSAMQSANSDTLVERTQKLGQAFGKMETYLGEGPYAKGPTLSNVDMAWMPLLHRAAIIFDHSGYDFVAGFPKVKAWQAALMETGIAEKSVSADFEQAFADFYLSQKTYLGRGENCHLAEDGETKSSCCG